MELPHKAMADSPKRMGRPKLGIISTTVRLPEAVLSRIDKVYGPNKRAQFLREAAIEKLERMEGGTAAAAAAGAGHGAASDQVRTKLNAAVDLIEQGVGILKLATPAADPAVAPADDPKPRTLRKGSSARAELPGRLDKSQIGKRKDR